MSVEFDEAGVTDMQALCYWAYSGLYEGDEDRRAELLDPRDELRRAGPVHERQDRGGRPQPARARPAVPAAPAVDDRAARGPGHAHPGGRRPRAIRPGRPTASASRTRGTRAAQPGIWIIGDAGQNPTRLTDSALDVDATWSPDGQRIAFAGRGRSPAGIYLVDAAGGTPTLIPGTNAFSRPSWSPDGRRIAAAVAAAGHRHLLARRAEHAEPDEQPGARTARPIGRRVAGRIIFTSDRADPERHGRAPAASGSSTPDGSDLTQLTFPFGSNTSGTMVEDHHPAWSPDGLSVTLRAQPPERQPLRDDQGATADEAVAVTPLPTTNTDHTFTMPDWQPVPVP